MLAAMDANHIRVAYVVGSVRGTFALPDADGWEGYRELNDQLLEVTGAHDRLLAFPAVRGDEADADELVADYVARGAVGLKMFGGYSPLKVGHLDTADYDPIFQAAARYELPIVNHCSLNYFPEEAHGMLERHPGVTFILPHLGFKKKDPRVLVDWLERHPNLYFDLSHGGLLGEALLKANADRDAYREFITAHSARLLWGSDYVLSNHSSKTVEDLTGYQRCSLGMLEGGEPFQCPAVAKQIEKAEGDPETFFEPLDLPDETLRDLYYRTALHVLPGVRERFGIVEPRR